MFHKYVPVVIGKKAYISSCDIQKQLEITVKHKYWLVNMILFKVKTQLLEKQTFFTLYKTYFMPSGEKKQLIVISLYLSEEKKTILNLCSFVLSRLVLKVRKKTCFGNFVRKLCVGQRLYFNIVNSTFIQYWLNVQVKKQCPTFELFPKVNSW